MRKSPVVAGIGFALVLCAVPATAQETSVRSSLWFTVGLGAGSAGIECPDCMGLLDERTSGLSGVLGLGWTLNPSIVVGVETQWWFKLDAFVPLGIVNPNAVVLFYPKKTLGLWLKGGAGYLWAGADGPGVTVEGSGLGWTLAAGYDFYLGRSVALTPYLSYVGSGSITTTVNDVPVDVSLSPNFFQAGLALTAP